MHPYIERLAELQKLDKHLYDMRARLSALPHEVAEIDKQLSAEKQVLAAAKEGLTTSLKERKTYEMDVDSWKEKARKYREQSFAVKSNEAYKALQQEIQHAEQETAKAEDRLLERMVAGEDFDRQIKAAEKVATAAEATASAARNKLKAEHDALQKQVTAEEMARKDKVAAVPAELLSTYERVANRRHGIGLAEVRDETCTLCGMRVRPHVFQELTRPESHEVFQCETCTRILYYVEPPPQAAAAAAPGGEAIGAAEGDALAEKPPGPTSKADKPHS